MAMKLSPEQRDIDNAIRAANRKLTTYARQFGRDSVQYRELESIVTSAFTDRYKTKSGISDMFRYSKDGILQITRNRQSIELVRLSATQQHMLQKIVRKKSVKEIKQGILQDWLERQTAGSDMLPEDLMKEMTAAEQRDVVNKEIKFYEALQRAIETCLDKIYDRGRTHTAKEREAVEHMRKTSKGRWTTREDLTDYLNRLTSSLGREGSQIKRDFYQQEGI